MEISNNKVVIMDYTLTNGSGEVLDTSEGRQPLAYIHGMGHIITGLEEALQGKMTGERIKAVIAPEDAYGTRSEELIQTVPITNFQDPDAVKEGVQFQASDADGMHIATVTKVTGDEVTLDMNHPLADETLHFDVEIKEVRDATEEELSHGHSHGDPNDHPNDHPNGNEGHQH